jgi:membrane protease YdiL (CAAX protease family)
MFAIADGVVMKALFTLALLCICYYLYYLVSSPAIWNRVVGRPGRSDNNPASLFLYQKVSGFILLGLLPAILFFSFFHINTHAYTMAAFAMLPDLLLFVIIFLLILIVTHFSARKADMYGRFPQMRLKEWGVTYVLISAGGWGMYLFAYEFLFRGLFLFTWTEAFGPVWAIAANLILYSAVHIPNGRKEAIGAIFFGFVLCLVSLHTGSFLMAFLLHLTVSVSTEMHAICFNPDMKFCLRGKQK